jgi:hypothetical protein
MAKPETSPTTGDHCSWIDSDGEADDRGCLATRHPRDPLSELARPVLFLRTLGTFFLTAQARSSPSRDREHASRAGDPGIPACRTE